MLGPMQVIAYFSNANTTDTNFIFFLKKQPDQMDPVRLSQSDVCFCPVRGRNAVMHHRLKLDMKQIFNIWSGSVYIVINYS